MKTMKQVLTALFVIGLTAPAFAGDMSSKKGCALDINQGSKNRIVQNVASLTGIKIDANGNPESTLSGR